MKPVLHLKQGSLRPAKLSDLQTVMHLLQGEGVRRCLCDDTFLPHDRVAEILERSELLDADGLGLWIIEY